MRRNWGRETNGSSRPVPGRKHRERPPVHIEGGKRTIWATLVLAAGLGAAMASGGAVQNSGPFNLKSEVESRFLHSMTAKGAVPPVGMTNSAAGNDVGELKVTIHEWDVPTKGAHPHDPAVGMDGALWFTEQMQNKIGRVDPATGAFKEYPLNVENSGPHGLVADREGNIWFTGNFAGYIGKLDPRTGKITQYKMPDASVEDPHTAVFDDDGILWFTAQVGNAVGRIDPRTGKVELKKVAAKNARPYGIQINSQGVPFFCEFGTNKIGKIDPKTMELADWTLPEGTRPRRLMIAADDSVYFTDFEGGNLGRLDPKTGAVKMWPSPGGHGAAPYGIAITPNGMVWYSESGVKPNTLIRFDPKTETMARATIPSGGGTVRNMAATADGRVYIACSGVNKVGVVEPAR
jgi:virginiamycin B lyase